MLIYTWISSKFQPYLFSCVIHVAFFMWIIGEDFQVYSTWIVSCGLMVYMFTWMSDGYHVKNATLFCFTCFPRVFFTWIIGVPIHVYIWWISSDVWAFFFSCVIHIAFLMWIIGVHFQVYSTWIVSRGLLVYHWYTINPRETFCKSPTYYVRGLMRRAQNNLPILKNLYQFLTGGPTETPRLILGCPTAKWVVSDGRKCPYFMPWSMGRVLCVARW